MSSRPAASPPFYPYTRKGPRLELAFLRQHPRLFRAVGPLLLAFFTGFILFAAFFLLFAVFVRYDLLHGLWLVVIAFNTVFVLGTIARMLFVPIRPTFYEGDYLPACSDAERHAAVERAERALQLNMKLLDTTSPARYCIKCAHFLPPRTSHCDICQRCVLERDHHCMWLNTCVSRSSLRLFWQLCLNVWLLALDGVVFFALLWYLTLTNPEFHFFTFSGFLFTYFLAMMSSITMSFVVFMSLMLFIHTRDILMGLTGVEIGERNTRERNGELVPPVPLEFRKFRELMGPTPVDWVFPTRYDAREE